MSFQRFNAAVVRRPALSVAILFILGIAAHRALPRCPLAWLITLAILLVAGVALFRQSTVCSILIALAIVVAGTCAGQLAEFYFPRDHIGVFAGDEPRLGWVEGRVRETPRVIESPEQGRRLPDKQVVSIAVRAVRTGAGWVAAEGEMPVTISPPLSDLKAGQRVRMLGRIERPPPAMNPGGFDAAGHYRRQRVLASMHVSRPYDIQILSAPHPLLRPLPGLRDISRRWLDNGFGEPRTTDRALLRALVFGDREPALRDVADDFTHTGTAHLLAANGSRVAILAGLIYLLCRLLRLEPRRALVVITATVVAFGFLTLPASAALRPVIVCVAVGIGLIGRRTFDSLQLLALATLAVLVLRPLDLYGAGFPLGFAIVLGLILFTRPLLQFLRRFEDRDKQIAKSFAPQSRWRRGSDRTRRRLIEAIAVSVVAWMVAAPLVAYHFEQFNPWTIPFSILLSPLAALAVVAGFAKIVLTAICPPLAGLWAQIAWLPATALRHVVHAFACVPASDLPVARPAVSHILLFYALLCLPLIPWARRRVRWCARCAPVGACVLLIALPLWGFGTQSTLSGGVRITLLSVGAGQCAVVEPAGGGVVLIDAGSSSISDLSRNCIEPFLRHEQCRSIDEIWLSHGDYDHISAIRQLVPEYGVRQVLASPHFQLHARESAPCAALLSMLNHTHHSPRQIVAGDRIRIGTDAEIEVLWPPADCSFNSNNAGLVLRLTCRGQSILFPADIQEPAEQELLKHPEKLRSDVLIAPHHGSSESTTPRFIGAVNPKYILASNDSRLTMKQRTFDAETTGRPLYRTSRCGAITIEIDRDGMLRIIPYLHPPAQ